MVSFHRSTLHQSILNLRLSALMILFYSHMIIMVSCASDRQQDKGKVFHNNKDFFQINQNELNEVRDSQQITEVKDLLLDEDSLQDFPIQEDGHIKWINIAESISQNHCKKFGILLLGSQRLLDVNSILEQNQDVACEMILLKWLNMEGANNKPITFRTLINVIHKLDKKFGNGYNELANKIAFTVEVHQIMDADYIPTKAREYSSKLFERYQESNVIDSSQWIPNMLDRNITFVDLGLKEGKNNNLILDDLLNDIQNGMRILFTGRPGVGKTTITRYLSKHIHKFKHFLFIIKLHIGILTGPINDLDTLLKIQSDKIFLSVDIAHISSFIKRRSGKGMCFLLDGYDEYVPTRHGNYIVSLIKGNELTKSVVIVTSRPSATKHIMYIFQRKIEIIGFAESRINTYLRQLQLPDVQNETIYRYLDNHPNVRQMCYLPLHLSMLVYMIIATNNSALTLVKTETELYYNFIALTIKHYEGVRHEIAVESLKECFSDPGTQTNLCDILKSISKSAFDGLSNNIHMFTSSSLTGLSRIANVSAEIEALSLFKIETFYDEGGIKFFKFWYVHPTFQEFLAAFHLATLPKKLYLDYTYLDIIGGHEVYKYYFGLIRRLSQYNDDTIVAMFIRFTADFRHLRHSFYIMKCAHEAGHDSKYIPYLQAAGIISQSNSLHIYLVRHNSHNCWYLGYVLARTSLHELKLQIVNEPFATKPDLTLCLLYILKYLKNDARFSGNANVTNLVIEELVKGPFTYDHEVNDILEIMDLGFLTIFQRRSTFLKLLLMIKQIDDLLQLGKILKSFKMLHGLGLLIDIAIFKEIDNALQDLTLLRHLELTVCFKTGDVPPNHEYRLEWNNLKQLQSLSIIFDFKIADYFNAPAMLGSWNHLEILYISWGILHTGKSTAREKLIGIQEGHNYNIKNLTLDLHLDETEYAGSTIIKEITKVLSSLRLFLKKLSLRIESFSTIEQVMIQLADGLGNLTELQELSLNFRRKKISYEILDKGAIVLADELKRLYNLHTLRLGLENSGNFDKLSVLLLSLINLHSLSITNSKKNDMKKLLNELKNLKQLQILDLSGNRIGDDDMEPLTESLKEINNLRTLDLSFNKIQDDGIKLLAELFDSPQQYLCNLKVLNLHGNTYSEVGAKILAEKLKKLHKIEVTGNYELTDLNAEILFLNYQQKVNKTPGILPQPTSPISMAEMGIYVFKQFHPYYYSIISIILGIIVYVMLVRVPLFFKSKVSKKFMQSTELSRALSCSTFSVSDAWHLKRLDSIGLNGTGTVVAILDTAIFQNFPSFTGKKILNITINESFPSFTGEEILVIDCLPHVPATSNEHGTLCSAIAVGSQCDTISGVVPRGVAPGARLIVYRIAEGDNYFPTEAILGALDDILNRLNSGIQIDVVSISYHYDVNDHQLKVFQEKIKILTEMGITFVAAAGNRGNYQALACIPARFDSVISVGALNKNGKRSSLTPQVKIDVYAPGDDLKFPTTDNIFWGTSYATPAVAGLVLLLKQWANHVGSPAKEIIHRVEILRKIFKQDMFMKSDSIDNHIDPLEPNVKSDSDGSIRVFDPVEFFMSMKDNPTMLNDIIQKYFG